MTARDVGQASMTFWGDGSPSWEFLYVEDVPRALAEWYEGSFPVNLWTGEEIAIHDLAALIAVEVGFAGHIHGTSPNQMDSCGAVWR